MWNHKTIINSKTQLPSFKAPSINVHIEWIWIYTYRMCAISGLLGGTQGICNKNICYKFVSPWIYMISFVFIIAHTHTHTECSNAFTHFVKMFVYNWKYILQNFMDCIIIPNRMCREWAKWNKSQRRNENINRMN